MYSDSPLSSKGRNEFFIKKIDREPFQPFWLFVRTMEQTGSHSTKGAVKSILYDMSRLSEGVRCAVQGRKFFKKKKLVSFLEFWFWFFNFAFQCLFIRSSIQLEYFCGGHEPSTRSTYRHLSFNFGTTTRTHWLRSPTKLSGRLERSPNSRVGERMKMISRKLRQRQTFIRSSRWLKVHRLTRIKP